uniref:Uncharacterized protein n=1 Tax=Panstrongylus lignarius TaxID=156445 RepID=A0A224XMY7_9HEMI
MARTLISECVHMTLWILCFMFSDVHGSQLFFCFFLLFHSFVSSSFMTTSSPSSLPLVFSSSLSPFSCKSFSSCSSCFRFSSSASLYPSSGRRSLPSTIAFTSFELMITPWFLITVFFVFSISARSTPRQQSSIRMVLYPIERASTAVAPTQTS